MSNNKIHKIAVDVDHELFSFYHTLLPHGDRGRLVPKLLSDLRSIHKANPTLIRRYLNGEFNLLQFKEEIKNG